MKTNENQKSTNHQPAAQKPFFGAGTEHAFFSTERAPSTPFFQPKAVSPSALQAKSVTSEAGSRSQPVVQLMPAFESEVNDNREVQRSLLNSPQQSSASPIQAKLTIGEPGDKYEQEADRVASQVVGQINAPASAQSTQGRSVQRQEEKPEELQAKSEITALQRQEEKPEELQAKSTQQRAIAGGEASTDLTFAINSARGGGQPLDAGLQRSMGQAMGADFSGVRVHTNTQSDQLNQSIQAKAFTTGKDVFFRQGAYQPGSRGGQELIAHELTHVVQQNGGVVQRSQTRDTGESQVPYLSHNATNKQITPYAKARAVLQRDACIIPDIDSPYANLDSPGGVGPYENFDSNQRFTILKENFLKTQKSVTFSKNADLQVDDEDGKQLIDPSTITPHIAAVDHIYPKAWGGGNHPRNAQIISQEKNSSKGDKYPWGKYTGWRIYDPAQNKVYNTVDAANKGGADMKTLKKYNPTW
ncbi:MULTISPECIES: eCIS core domain-containing protein [Nostocales]|uniref:eCIS core domain-containing protein n=1 Tax=Nostocales TaxID=1161 RepID=UPI0004B0B80D|nr:MULTISPECIES: DUF4157 domain-containing protein [Nostocales]